MQTKFLVTAFALLGLVQAGCSTVDSRARRQPDFANWPPAVQEKVRAGQVDLGFTVDQVRVALGEPDRVFSRTTSDGTTEVWTYRDRGPRFSFGLGLGSARGSTGVGGGLMIGSGYRDDEKLGVVFDRMGRVAAIESRGR